MRLSDASASWFAIPPPHVATPATTDSSVADSTLGDSTVVGAGIHMHDTKSAAPAAPPAVGVAAGAAAGAKDSKSDSKAVGAAPAAPAAGAGAGAVDMVDVVPTAHAGGVAPQQFCVGISALSRLDGGKVVTVKDPFSAMKWHIAAKETPAAGELAPGHAAADPADRKWTLRVWASGHDAAEVIIGGWKVVTVCGHPCGRGAHAGAETAIVGRGQDSIQIRIGYDVLVRA